MESFFFSPISFETCLDQWYELDTAEDLISRLIKTDNLDLWNTEVDLLNIETEGEDMRGGERTVTVDGEDKNTEKGEKDKGMRKNIRMRGKRQGAGGKDKGSESIENDEKEKVKNKTRVRGKKDKGRVKDKGMGKNTRE